MPETRMSDTLKRLQTRDANAICSTYGRYPLAIARGRGSRLYDVDGNEYIDLLAGLAVTNLGHCHPAVSQAVCDQVQELVHVSNLVYQEQNIALAEELLATCSPPLNKGRAFFCNSGAEANEAAIKLARRYMREVKGRDAHEVITLEGSFHGRTLAAVAATGQQKIKNGFDPLPQGFVHVPFGDLYTLEEAITERTAAVLIEMVQGEGGVHPLDQAFASGVAGLCKERGILLMVDEIQTGMGRTGRMWAHQHYNLDPDVMTVAKGLANGLPMGAMIATADAAKGFAPGAHATTFGGGPVLAAAARAVLKTMDQQNLPERAALLGSHALELFNGLKAKHPESIKEVRGIGLMLGIELTFPGQAVWQALLDAGYLLNLTHDTVLRLLPALTIDQADLDNFAAALDTILGAQGASA